MFKTLLTALVVAVCLPAVTNASVLLDIESGTWDTVGTEGAYFNRYNQSGYRFDLPTANDHHFHLAPLDPGYLAFHEDINNNAVNNLLRMTRADGGKFDLLSFQELGRTIGEDYETWENSTVQVTTSNGDYLEIGANNEFDTTFNVNWTNLDWVEFDNDGLLGPTNDPPIITVLDNFYVQESAVPEPTSAVSFGILVLGGFFARRRLAA